MSVDILNKVNTSGTKKCIPVRDLIKDIKSKVDADDSITLKEIADDFNSQAIYNSRGRPYGEALISWGILTYLGESYRRNERYVKTSSTNKALVDNSSQIAEGIQVKTFKKSTKAIKAKTQKQISSSTDDLVTELSNRGYKVTLTK